jgi:hypothetical protein
VTYRDEGLTAVDPLRQALGELANQRSTRRIALPPLSAEAVAAMASGSKFAAADLFKLTGGNPFYVSEVVDAGTDEIPPSASDAVLARTARLGSAAAGVLDVAALVGSRVEIAVLEAVTTCQPANLDELVASGLVVTGGGWRRSRAWSRRGCAARAGAGHRGVRPLRGARHRHLCHLPARIAGQLAGEDRTVAGRSAARGGVA